MSTETAENFGFKKLADAEPRTCANCGCAKLEKHAQLANVEQLFCRRDPVQSAKVRVERAMVDPKTKQPLFLRDGKTPRTEVVEDLAFMYRPTVASATCFDGWRPLGTLPGEKFQNAGIDEMIANLFTQFKKLGADMMRDSLDVALCAHSRMVGAPCPECPDGIATGVDADKETH